MNDIHNDETFLARWLNDELTGEELANFKNHPDFPIYQQLKISSATLSVQDIDTEVLLDKIKSNNRFRRRSIAKKSNLFRRIFIPAAAILLLIIGYFSLMQQPDLILKTQTGEQLRHELPDGSMILLNANSEISYNPKPFKSKREIFLSGEAFFEVEKGVKFIVATDLGEVEVLGTSFSVYSRSKTLISSCKTGTVRVKNAIGQTQILNKGERIKLLDGLLNQKEIINPASIASWQEGVSRFESESLSIVAKAIENQFGVELKLAPGYSDEKFTGSFLHQDIETALKMVFVPMGMEYEKTGKDSFIIR